LVSGVAKIYIDGQIRRVCHKAPIKIVATTFFVLDWGLKFSRKSPRMKFIEIESAFEQIARSHSTQLHSDDEPE